MNKTFFSSDLHFFHANIIKFCPNSRPWSSLEEMHECLIDGHNSVVTDNDDWYCLGDFSFKAPSKDAVSAIFSRLKGRRHLIFGNHEEDAMHLPWASKQHYKELKINKKKLVLFHYPIESWNGMYHNRIHLHGHVHSDKDNPKTIDLANRLDVGVDNIGPKPISYEEVLARFDNKETTE